MEDKLSQYLPIEKLLDMRVEYAHRCFCNTQELICFMDQKAGFVLAAVGVLSAALGTLRISAVLSSRTSGCILQPREKPTI